MIKIRNWEGFKDIDGHENYSEVEKINCFVNGKKAISYDKVVHNIWMDVVKVDNIMI